LLSLASGSSCSEDPDVKGTETQNPSRHPRRNPGCSEDPDVKGTETKDAGEEIKRAPGCSEDPDVKGTETQYFSFFGCGIF